MAFALTPVPPIVDWLAELDGWLRGASDFFVGKPVVLDLSAVTLTSSAIAHLISELGTRGIRIMGLEGVAVEKLGPSLPPLVTGGRPAPVEAINYRAQPPPPPPARDREPTSLSIRTVT
jgi:septum site-determining protein MinC